MKRWSVAALCLCLALCICGAASANQWGLHGQQDALRGTDYYRYNGGAEVYDRAKDYSVFIMTSRYHDVLIVTEKNSKGKWEKVEESTAALWQPGSGSHKVKLKSHGTWGFTMTVTGEDAASFTFDRRQKEMGGRACMTLTSATVDHLTFEMNDDFEGYSVYDADMGADLTWQTPAIALEEFNISLMPRTVEDVLRLNEWYALLGDNALTWHKQSVRGASGSAAVYSAPDPESYRAASGKAAVSISGGFTLYGQMEDYALVEYRVSTRTRRIGCIAASKLPKKAKPFHFDAYIKAVPTSVDRATYLTDDPHVSQFPIIPLDVGAKVTVLGQWNASYAYVETETGKGKRIRGFVPLTAIALPSEPDSAPAIAALTGEWGFASGGTMQADHLSLRAGGACACITYRPDRVSVQGTLGHIPQADEILRTDEMLWTAVNNISAWNLQPDGVDYVLIFRQADGSVYRYGAQITDDNYLSLTHGEGGGGYERVE